MTPKIPNRIVWQQAEVLMQPAFIRLIANITQQLEQSDWRGDYEDVQMWPEGTSETDKMLVASLRSQLETASPAEVDAITQSLAQLPTPFPGYQLRLSRGDRQVSVDLWDLCYRICFQDYDSVSGTSHAVDAAIGGSVVIDPSLFDETGDVDWHQLDDKTKQLVNQIFANLPA
ncbi:hypothetical protein [Leptodesmis sichuanensis]|uniref:hypothetical protein n=1 Tax=Leptodesmis sichuanensis TaxID=2906798 RepID=UPI001F1AAC5D|nr:hypothetical protein [Leptodesmis sichuanensis]UIE35936.1 hypothetical protein KIK02_12620 [Leptodesmis sichuanensis A121]